MQTPWTGWLLVFSSLAWNLLATFLGPYLSSGLVLFAGALAPQIFLFPVLWLAYGILVGAKRGVVAAGIVLVCSIALWIAWRLRPEGKYMNVVEDVMFAVFLTAWMVTFLIGSAIHWVTSRPRGKPAA